jgi:hypothetical protein
LSAFFQNGKEFGCLWRLDSNFTSWKIRGVVKEEIRYRNPSVAAATLRGKIFSIPLKPKEGLNGPPSRTCGEGGSLL